MLIHVLSGILRKSTPFACSICIPKVSEEFAEKKVSFVIYRGPFYLKCYLMKTSYLAIGGSPMEWAILQSIQMAQFPIHDWALKKGRDAKDAEKTTGHKPKEGLNARAKIVPSMKIKGDNFCECHILTQADGDRKPRSMRVSPLDKF